MGGVAAGHRSEEDTRKQHPPALITVTGTACEEERVSMVSREATPDENTSTRTSVSELMETPQKVVPVGRGSQDDKRDDVSGEPPTARTPEEIPSTFTAMDTSGKGAMAPSDAAGAGGRETPPPEEDVTEKEVVPPPGQSPRRESVPGGGEISPPAVARNTERLFERGDVASMDKAEERGAVMEISNGGEDRAGDVLPSSLATLDDVLQPLADTDRPQKPVCTGLAAKSVGDEAGVGVVVADASRAESAMASPPVSVENRIATDYVTSFFASPTILELAKVAMSVEGTSTPEPSSGATRHLESNSSSNVLSAVEQGSDLAAAMSPPVQQPPESSHLHSALSSDGLRDEDVAMGNDQKGGSAGTNEPTDTPCSSVEIRVMENDSVPKQLDITDAATTTPPPRDESPAVECVEDPPSADAKHASSRSAALPGDESDDAAAARAQPPVNELGSVPLVVVPGLENHDDAGVSEGGVSSSKAIDVRVISDNPVAVEGRALVDEVILSCLVTAAAAVAATARAEIKPTGYASSVSASSLDKNARNSVRTPSSTGAKCQAEAEPSSPSSRSAGSARSVTLGSSVDDKRDTAGIEEGRSDRGSALSIEIAPTSVFPHAPTTVETRVVADYFDQIVPDILNKIVRETGTATTSTRDISSTSTSHLDNESRKSLRTPSSEGAISQTAGEPPRPSARPVGLSESVTLFDPSPVDDKGGDSTAKEGGNDGSDTVSIENTPTPVCSRVSTTIEARVVADYLNITVRNYLNQTVRDAALASTSTRDIASAHAGRLDNESTNCWRSSLSSKAVRCQADTEPPPQSAGPAVGPPITSMALCGSVEDKGSDSTVKAGSDARGGTLIVETTPTPVSSHAFTAVNGRVVADYLNQSFRDAATAVGQTTPGAVSGIATENTGAGSSTCQRKTPDCLPTSAISQDLNVPTDGGSTLSVEAGPTPAYPHDSTTLEARVVADYLNQTTRDVVMAESQSIPGAASRTTPQDTGAGSTCLPNRQNASPTASKDVNVFIFPEGEPPAVFSTTPTTVSVVAVHGLLGNAAESTENSPAMQTTDPNSINTRSNDRPSSSSSGSLEAAVAGDYLSEVSRRLATAEAEATKIVSPGVRNSLGELPGLVDDGQGLVSKADVVDGDRNMQPSSFVLVNDPVASPRTTSTAGSDKAVENFTSCEPLPVTEENSANAASLLASANNEKHSVAATPLSIPRSTVEIQDGPKRPCDEQPVGKSNLSLPPDTSGVEEGQTRGCISHRNSSPPSSASDRTAVVNEDISNRVGGVSLEEEGAVTASSASAEPGEPGSTPGKGSDMVVPELDVTGELVAVMSPENLAVVCADGDLDTVSGGSEPMHDGGNPLALNRATIDGCDGDKIRVDDDSIDVPVSSNSGDRDRKTPPESNENDEQSMAVDDADNILSPSPPVHLQTAVVADYLSGAFARLLHSETATTSEPAPCGVPSALIVSKHIRTPPLTSPTPPGTSQEGDKELERELDSSSPIGDDAAKTLSPRSGVEDALSWPQEEKSARVKIAQSSVEQIGGGEAAELTAMATAQPDRESEINSCEKEVKQPSPCRSVGALSELQQVEPRAQCQQEPPEGAEMAADTGACPAARGVEEFESAANKSNPIDDCGQAPHPSVETVPCLQAAGAAQVNCPQDYADGVSVDMGAGLAARGAEELERQTENRDLTEDTAPTPPCPSVEALPLKAEGHVESQQGGVAEVKENEVSGLAARGMAELERPRASEASSTGGLSRPSLQPELEVCSGSRAALTSPAVLATLGEEQATPAPHPTPNNDEMTAIYTPCPTGVLGKTADCIVTECPLPQGGNPALGRDDVPSCDRSPSADRTAPAPWIDPTTITNNTLRQRNSRHDTDHEVVPTAEPATDLRQMLEVGENEWARVSLSRTPPFDALNNPNPALRWAPVGHAGTGSIDAGGKSCASPPPHFPAVTSTAAAAESVDKGGAEVTGVCATQQPGGGGATAADGSLATINDNRGSEWGFFFAPPHRMAPTGDACGVDGFGSADASPGSTIRGDSTAGSDCFLSSSHVTTGNDGDERRGFRWSSTGDDDETASEESWGVLGKVQNPPDEARRRMMMRNNRGGACLVGEGGGGEVGGWKRAREGGMVESRTLASSGTVSLPKRNSRKRWNKAAERSRQYTRRWEVFLSQAGRYFEGEVGSNFQRFSLFFFLVLCRWLSEKPCVLKRSVTRRVRCVMQAFALEGHGSRYGAGPQQFVRLANSPLVAYFVLNCTQKHS